MTNNFRAIFYVGIIVCNILWYWLNQNPSTRLANLLIFIGIGLCVIFLIFMEEEDAN